VDAECQTDMVQVADHGADTLYFEFKYTLPQQRSLVLRVLQRRLNVDSAPMDQLPCPALTLTQSQPCVNPEPDLGSRACGYMNDQ
jgi:hypothetical protein